MMPLTPKIYMFNGQILYDYGDILLTPPPVTIDFPVDDIDKAVEWCTKRINAMITEEVNEIRRQEEENLNGILYGVNPETGKPNLPRDLPPLDFKGLDDLL